MYSNNIKTIAVARPGTTSKYDNSDHFKYIPIETKDFSSTKVRNAMFEGKNYEQYLHPKVSDYIKKNRISVKKEQEHIVVKSNKVDLPQIKTNESQEKTPEKSPTPRENTESQEKTPEKSTTPRYNTDTHEKTTVCPVTLNDSFFKVFNLN